MSYLAWNRQDILKNESSISLVVSQDLDAVYEIAISWIFYNVNPKIVVIKIRALHVGFALHWISLDRPGAGLVHWLCLGLYWLKAKANNTEDAINKDFFKVAFLPLWPNSDTCLLSSLVLSSVICATTWWPNSWEYTKVAVVIHLDDRSTAGLKPVLSIILFKKKK